MSAITDNGPFLCVEEVVRLSKISRTKAYKEARIGRSIRFLSELIERMTAGRISARTPVAPRPTDLGRTSYTHALMKVTNLHHRRAWPSRPRSSRRFGHAEHPGAS